MKKASTPHLDQGQASTDNFALPEVILQEQSAKMQNLNWDDLRYVIVLSRTGRLATAARQLHVDETTIARRVARVERALGSRLFERANGQLLLTETGHEVLRHAEQIEMGVCGIKSVATGLDDRAAGTVRLTSVALIMNRILLPALPEFLRAHPQLQLHLVSEPRNLDIGDREIDIAVRFARPEQDYRLVARRICELPYGVFGAVGYSTEKLPWVTYEESLSALPLARWLAEAVKQEPDLGPGLIVNDSDLAMNAVHAGLGRSLMPICVGDHDEGLVRLSGAESVLTRELWLLVRSDLKHLARIKLVIEWIERVFAEMEARCGERAKAMK
ncbi:LysR family transcriptional regulator [Methylosinus sp. LW3]|uniref:LysR family transcriptional regulator n=1 Tax=Methylosinus sp. LW3 TaxID=107635 RepID=UPI001FDA4CB2|nr:LysR family transcriptional regulator [Methylosinus sp. LW3]